jgi:signal transduction histidine kinase
MAEKSGITIKSDLACELPPCLIDVGQLRQVFLNLLKNALEAMPKGGTITVRCGYRPGLPLPARSLAGGRGTQTGRVSKKGGSVTVEVEDTGIGVPSRDLETIFRAFYSTKQKGMGLGLSLCRGIIEKHGGRIRVESQESKGSCFIVEIPSDQAS